jgi:hypothetical protein
MAVEQSRWYGWSLEGRIMEGTGVNPLKTAILLAIVTALIGSGVALAHPDPDTTKRPCHDETSKPCRLADARG